MKRIIELGFLLLLLLCAGRMFGQTGLNTTKNIYTYTPGGVSLDQSD